MENQVSASNRPNKGTTVPWRRIVVESVAIMLSILLAFAIDASWDAFKERNQEKAFLESLLDDFQETRSRIDESTNVHMRFVDLAGQLLDFHGGDTPDIEPAALETMLGAVFFDWSSLYLPSGSRDALFSSGDIEIISNEQLRAMLASWPSMVADAAEDDAWIAKDVMNNMAPYLRGMIRIRNVARLTSPDAAERIPGIESVNYDALWDDPTFDNIVSFRILNETYALRENDRLSEAVDEIIRTIEKELQR
jgi:hypothetical protein